MNTIDDIKKQIDQSINQVTDLNDKLAEAEETLNKWISMGKKLGLSIDELIPIENSLT